MFLSVVETRNLSETARALGVSTSAVSAAIVRLEQKLSVRLLNRTTRRVNTTPEGVEFYERCKKIIADLEQAELSVGRSGRVPSGRLRIGMPSALARMWIVPRLPEFLEANPSISLEIISGDFMAGAGADGFDASVHVGDIPSSSLAVRKLATVRYVVCASSKYLSARGVPEQPDDLAHHDCLTYRRPRNGRIRQWKLKSGSTAAEIDIDGCMTFNSGETLVTAAATGLGVVQVAEYYARPLLNSGQLVEVLAGYKVDAYDISVIFQKQKRAAPRLRVFVDFLVKLFNPPPWSVRRRG